MYCISGLSIRFIEQKYGVYRDESVTPETVTIYLSQDAFAIAKNAVHHFSVYLTKDSTRYFTIYRCTNGSYHWYCDPQIEFLVNSQGTEVHVKFPTSVSQDDIIHLVLGPILSFLLRLRNRVSLHASALLFGQHAILFAGVSGVGKSTTAATFALRGFSVIADDVCALVDQQSSFLVLPSRPQIRLFPKTATALWEEMPALASDNSCKVAIDTRQSGLRHYPEPAPLGAIYILQPRSSDLDRPLVQSPMGHERLLQLLPHSFGTRFLNREMRQHDFDVLGRVSRNVPIRTVKAIDDLGQLPELIDAILVDSHSLHL